MFPAAKSLSLSREQWPLHPSAPCPTKSALAASGSPWAGQGAASSLGAPTRFGTRATPCLHEGWLSSHPKELDRTRTLFWGRPCAAFEGKAQLHPEVRHNTAARVAASCRNSKMASQVLKIRGSMQFTSCSQFSRGEKKLFGNSGRLCHFIVRNTCTKCMFSFYS